MLTLRSSLSRIAQQFDITIAPGQDVEGFENGAQDTFTTTLRPLNLTFTPRN